MKKFNLILLLLFAFGGMVLLFSSTSCDDENENAAPVITQVSFEPSTVHASGTVKVTVVADDPEDDPITISYAVAGGTVQGKSTFAVWNVPETAGEHKITVTATDSEGNKTSTEKSITALSPVTQIAGCAELQGGAADLSNSKVFLYSSYPTSASPIKNVLVDGDGTCVTFNITDIVPGDYYILLWKDADANGQASMNDLIGWYGTGSYYYPEYTKIQVAEGKTFNCVLKTYVAEN
jgi:hypothetical protein